VHNCSTRTKARGFGLALQHPRQIVFIFASNFEFSTASMSTTVPCSSVGVLDAAGLSVAVGVLDVAGLLTAVGGAALS
jgi:hypothetical protein